jgi:hypothetical protein
MAGSASPLLAFLRALGKPTVDDSTLTYKPERTGGDSPYLREA